MEDETKTHESFGDRHETLHIELVLAQIEHLQRPIPLQYLREVCHTRLQEPISRPDRPHAHETVRLTRRSLPLRSSVRSAPNRGNVSNARTLSNNAALGPSSRRPGAPFTPTPSVLARPGAGCRVVTPPCELDVMIGTGWPVAESGFGGCVAPVRFDRGIYGV